MKTIDITPEQAAEMNKKIRASRRAAAQGRKVPVRSDRRQASINAGIAIRGAK